MTGMREDGTVPGLAQGGEEGPHIAVLALNSLGQRPARLAKEPGSQRKAESRESRGQISHRRSTCTGSSGSECAQSCNPERHVFSPPPAMEVEATSLGAAAFAAPSPMNTDSDSSWMEITPAPAPAPAKGEEGGRREGGMAAEASKGRPESAKEGSAEGRRDGAQDAVAPAADTQKMDFAAQPEAAAEASSALQLAPAQQAPSVPSQSEPRPAPSTQLPSPNQGGSAAQEASAEQHATQDSSQTIGPLSQPGEHTQTELQLLDSPSPKTVNPPQPLSLQQSLLTSQIDALASSQPNPPETPVKDNYAELANAVADLNLPTNALLPADLDLASYEAEEAAPVQEAARDDPMQAFAKLQFPDGDFYVNTYAVELGRDLNAAKYERKVGRMQKHKLKRDVKREVDRDIKMEEGAAGHSMARSNVSESGGIVGVNIDYDSDHDDHESRRRKRKQLRSTNSSHSVDPTSLHANPYDLSLDLQPQPDKPFEYECPFIPIHPQAGQSFKNISRKHVRIEYNLQKATWEMLVIGRNGAFHDDVHLDKGHLVKLHHGSEILIQGITIIFKLPDNARDDDDEEEDGAHVPSDSDSSLSDLESLVSATLAHSDRDASSEDEPLRLKRPSKKKERPRRIVKLKLSLKKNFPAVAGKPIRKEDKEDREKAKKKDREKEKAQEKEKEKDVEEDAEKEKEKPSKTGKQSTKTDRVENADQPDKAEKTTIKAEKLEKPKKAEKAEKTIVTTPKATTAEKAPKERRESAISTTEMAPPATPDVKQSIEGEHDVTASETPPVVPADLPPGSILAGLAPDEIPQKRKGPGRPPKNGVMSKRDEAIIKRKTKELQKLGKAIPPLAELLALARAEGGTKKETKSEDAREGEGPRQSVEIDPALMAQDLANATPSAEVKTEGSAQATQPTPDKEAAKPKRIVKSPSPQKPESEYTEEELKKPTQTYVVLIHEALSKSPTGVMDLQQIYDAMQKMYPWFKYRSTTHGWQSSVRHNLISSEAFEEAGKIGKGRLWKINPSVSIDKEKKRKAPTPPPERPPQQYPYYPNGQYPYGHPGAPAYGAYARPSPYGTPYGPPTVQNPVRPPVPTAQQKPGTYYSPYASTTPGAATQGSPYGPPSRAPYAPYPQPPRPPGSVYGQPPQQPQPQPGQPPAPAQQGQVQPGQAQQSQPPQGQPPQGPMQPGQAPHLPNGQAYHQQPGQSPAPPNGQPQPYPPQQSPQGRPPAPMQAQGPPPVQGPPPPQSGITSEKMIDNIMDYHKRYLSVFQGPEQEKHRAIFRKATNRHIHRGVDLGPFESEEEEKLYNTIQDIISQTQAETASAPPPQTPQPNGARPAQPAQVHDQTPPAPMQGASGQVPHPPPANAPYPRPPGQQQQGPQQGMAPQAPQAAMTPQPGTQTSAQQKQGSVPAEKELVQALKTAMPNTPANAQGGPAPPLQAGVPRPALAPHVQPASPYQPQQRGPPVPGQQQTPQVRTNVATVPPTGQAPPPRPTFTAPSHPPSAATNPAHLPQGSAPGTPRPVAPAQAQPSPAPQAIHVQPPVQPSPSPAVSQAPTPAPPASMQAAPTSTMQTPTPAAQAPPAPNSAPVASIGLVPSAATPAASMPPSDGAGSSLKRPIELDDDDDHEVKKQKTETPIQG